MGFEYTSDSTSERWLILSDTSQEWPEEDFTVEEAKEATTSNGKTMPVLILKGCESGDVVRICAWKRDVLDCIKQYGGHPEQWDKVGFKKKNNRYILEPRGMQVKTEDVGKKELLKEVSGSYVAEDGEIKRVGTIKEIRGDL